MIEHVLFLYLGLEDGDNVFKKEAFEIYYKFFNFMEKNFMTKEIKSISKPNKLK